MKERTTTEPPKGSRVQSLKSLLPQNICWSWIIQTRPTISNAYLSKKWCMKPNYEAEGSVHGKIEAKKCNFLYERWYKRGTTHKEVYRLPTNLPKNKHWALPNKTFNIYEEKERKPKAITFPRFATLNPVLRTSSWSSLLLIYRR